MDHSCFDHIWTVAFLWWSARCIFFNKFIRKNHPKNVCKGELFSADWLSVNALAYSAPLQQWADCCWLTWSREVRLRRTDGCRMWKPNAKLLILRDPVKCVGQWWMTTVWLAGNPNSPKPCLAYVPLCVRLCTVVSPLLISSCHTGGVNTDKSPHRTRVLMHTATSTSSSDAAEQCPSLPTESTKL